jgi:hypothetical protein
MVVSVVCAFVLVLPSDALGQVTDGLAGAQDAQIPLAHSYSGFWAIGIGALGSAAYLYAAFTGFIGQDADARSRILAHLGGGLLAAAAKVAAFALIGGGVAMVFQLTEHYLVPVQAFILGCSWPAVVANYLSARQQGADPSVETEVARTLHIVRRLEKTAGALEGLPTSPVDSEAARRELDEILKGLPGSAT